MNISNIRIYLFICCSLWIVLLIIFRSYPVIDIYVSNLFFENFTKCEYRNKLGVCGYFPIGRQYYSNTIRKLLYYIPSFSAILILFFILYRYIIDKVDINYYLNKICICFLFSFIVGPYLLVNIIIKTYSHRPRPYETDLFGGRHLFTPAGSFNGTCNNNCSFISGEAAAAGWFACLLLLMPNTVKRKAAIPILVLSISTCLLRIAYGGHYLSDVILGWLSSPIVLLSVLIIMNSKYISRLLM